ncbi:g1514 [Coccomyxa elongata]
MFAKDRVSNGAASLQESRAGDPAAEGSQGPASALEEVLQEADEPAASASSAKNRLQMDLDRQRGNEGESLDMRSRKEVLRQLRTGEEGGLPEAERLRRLRISAANKGRAPWNVGRKHSPETIEKIRQGTTKAMRDPNVRQKLIVSHEPKTQSESSREKISRGVTLSILRRQGVDIASMTEEQLNALVRERKAEKQAEALAREARRAQRQQDMEASQQLEEHYGARHRRHMLSKGYIERLRNGDITSATVTAAENAAAPRRRKAAKKAAVDAAPEQASDADSSAAEALPKQAPARRRPAVRGAAAAAAKKRAAAEAAAAAGEARARQLKRALMLVIKLEQALQQCYKHQEVTVRSASTEERERVENVVSNAQEQLLRAKGQVARLQQGAPVSNALSPEEMDALSRILSDSGAAAGRPQLARFKRALAHDRGGRASFESPAGSTNGAAADAVLDIEAERL